MDVSVSPFANLPPSSDKIAVMKSQREFKLVDVIEKDIFLGFDVCAFVVFSYLTRSLSYKEKGSGGSTPDICVLRFL